MPIILIFFVIYLLLSPKASKKYWRFELATHDWAGINKYDLYVASDTVERAIQVLLSEYDAAGETPFVITDTFNELSPSLIKWSIFKRKIHGKKGDYGRLYFSSVNEIMSNINRGSHFILAVLYQEDGSLFLHDEYDLTERCTEDFFNVVHHNRRVIPGLIRFLEGEKVYSQKHSYDLGQMRIDIYII